MKKLFFRLFLSAAILVSFTEANAAPDLDWYRPGWEHPAYMTALSFSSDPDFIRGICFAFDAAKEMVNYGSAGIMKKEVSVSNNNTVVITIGMYGIASSTWGGWCTTFAESSEGVRDYANTLTDLQNQNLWLGYACLMEQAAGNPNIVNTQNGQSW